MFNMFFSNAIISLLKNILLKSIPVRLKNQPAMQLIIIIELNNLIQPVLLFELPEIFEISNTTSIEQAAFHVSSGVSYP